MTGTFGAWYVTDAASFSKAGRIGSTWDEWKANGSFSLVHFWPAATS